MRSFSTLKKVKIQVILSRGNRCKTSISWLKPLNHYKMRNSARTREKGRFSLIGRHNISTPTVKTKTLKKYIK